MTCSGADSSDRRQEEFPSDRSGEENVEGEPADSLPDPEPENGLGEPSSSNSSPSRPPKLRRLDLILLSKGKKDKFGKEEVPDPQPENGLVGEPLFSNRSTSVTSEYKSLDLISLRKYKKDCTKYGPTSPNCIKFLKGWSKRELWVPEDFRVVARTCLSSSQYMQWRMWLSEEAKTVLHLIAQRSISGVQLTHDMLVGEGEWTDVNKQATLPSDILTLVREIALWSWGKIDADIEFIGSYTKIFQETYAQRVALYDFQRLRV